MVPASRPADEVRIDVPLVRRLIAAQFPQWAGLPVVPAGAGVAGTDNVMYRLGPDLAVRLPRRPFGADHLEREYRWLPVVGPGLPLAVPAPAGMGAPGEGYPWPWMVCSWLPGEVAALAPVADPHQAAVALARFVAALRAVDRRTFRQALAVDGATWSRARGWAVNLGLRAAAWAGGNSVLAAIGRDTIASVVADAHQASCD